MISLPVRVRRMTSADLGRVMAIARSLKEAPHWPLAAYETALDPQAAPRRIALVAEWVADESAEKRAAGAKAHVPSARFMPGLKPRPTTCNAQDPGGIVGFAVASVVPPQAELETIAVAAEGQRRGVGRNLFAVLAGELAIAHVEELFLEVRASNRAALALYLSLGFSQTGCRPRYYIDPVEDALLLDLRLA
jgi:ribosomal-protein-alanine N-acetyltransferase